MSDSADDLDKLLGPDGWTVRQLNAEFRRLRTELAQLILWLGRLDAWAADLPNSHRPNREAVLVEDLIRTDSPDPGALVRDVLQAGQTIVALREALLRVNHDVHAMTGIFAASLDPLGDLLIDRQIHVTVFVEGPEFHRQRNAVRRSGLTFRPRDRTWCGLLPASWAEAPEAWTQLATAGELGADIRLSAVE